MAVARTVEHILTTLGEAFIILDVTKRLAADTTSIDEDFRFGK
jgi:hypothetical protein